MVAIGDVFAFRAARTWVPCQVIGARARAWEVVVFDAVSTTRPAARAIDGAAIYVIRHGKPRNEPLYLVCDGTPPATYVRLGRRPVALAFALPETFRTSPRAGEDTLPVWATWTYAIDRVKLDRAKQPPPFRSRLFPTWRAMDPRALRAIDAAVRAFAAVGTEAALRRTVRAINRHESEIDTISREELCDRLIAIAQKKRIAGARAAAVIDEHRAW